MKIVGLATPVGVSAAALKTKSETTIGSSQTNKFGAAHNGGSGLDGEDLSRSQILSPRL
jgi:hypothetical protein